MIPATRPTGTGVPARPKAAGDSVFDKDRRSRGASLRPDSCGGGAEAAPAPVSIMRSMSSSGTCWPVTVYTRLPTT